LPESCHERAEILVPVEIHGIKGGGAEEDLDDLCVLILASFVPDLLESFSEILVICDGCILGVGSDAATPTFAVWMRDWSLKTQLLSTTATG
jgi:hypothetical protein